MASVTWVEYGATVVDGSVWRLRLVSSDDVSFRLKTCREHCAVTQAAPMAWHGMAVTYDIAVIIMPLTTMMITYRCTLQPVQSALSRSNLPGSTFFPTDSTQSRASQRKKKIPSLGPHLKHHHLTATTTTAPTSRQPSPPPQPQRWRPERPPRSPRASTSPSPSPQEQQTYTPS